MFRSQFVDPFKPACTELYSVHAARRKSILYLDCCGQDQRAADTTPYGKSASFSVTADKDQEALQTTHRRDNASGHDVRI